MLIGEPNVPDEGKIFIGRACISIGYLFDSSSTSLDFVNLQPVNEIYHGVHGQNIIEEIYFRTGDFARRLESGDYVFVGRKDRLVKIHGQHISLEEVEDNLKDHPEQVLCCRYTAEVEYPRTHFTT
jgi:acyl-CoA synthetase